MSKKNELQSKPKSRVSVEIYGLPDMGEYRHQPGYDVRNASEGYSNIAAVLSGFAFTGILLIVQVSNLSKVDEFARDQTVIAFLIAFIGCLLSAFTFAIVKGEEVLTPRSYAIALLGACGFTISANLLIWGVATIAKVYLSKDVYVFILYSFPAFMCITPIYTAYSAFDPIMSFDKRLPTLTEYIQELAPAFFPVFIFIPIKYYMEYLNITFSSIVSIGIWFNIVMAGAFLLILVSAIRAIFTTMNDYSYRIPLLRSGAWVGFHSLVVGILILMT